MADISRSDAAALIQEGYSEDFLSTAATTSAVLQAFPTRPMGNKTVRMPVLATQPHAKWVGESATAPSGVKPSGKATWGNKELIAEELAVIVPIHENVIADASEATLSEIAKAGGRAIAYGLDAAVLFGVNKPTTWTSPALAASATAAGNVFTVGTKKDDLSGCILQAAEAVSAHYDPTDILSRKGLRYRLANQRNIDGTPVFIPTMNAGPESADSVHGLKASWVSGTVSNGSGGDAPVWDADEAEALVVDRERVIIGVRQDITVKYLDQATVDGINLAERDMVAFRFVARYAYALGDNIATGSQVSTNSPVGLVKPTAPAGG